MTRLIIIALSLVLLAGCAVRRQVRAYNERETLRCHAACSNSTDIKRCQQRCDALPYPACESGNFGGQACQ